MSTATPLFDRRPLLKRSRRRIGPAVDEEKDRRQVAIFIVLFTTVAILLCAVVAIVSGDTLDGKLWLVWLIFVGGLSKLLLANGVFWGMLRQDEQVKAEQAARAASRGTRSLVRATRNLAVLSPRPVPSRPARARGPLTLAADNSDRTPGRDRR